MSFKDYANHIYQKHQLAVALAILKLKPVNVKTEAYVEELKSKIDKNFEVDDMSVCSADFLMADDEELNDSVTILKDFALEFVNNDDSLVGDKNIASEKAITETEMIDKNIPDDLSQITYYDSSQNQDKFDIVGPFNDVTQSLDVYNLSQNIDIEESTPINIAREVFNDKTTNFDQYTDPIRDIMVSQVNQKTNTKDALPNTAGTKELNEEIRHLAKDSTHKTNSKDTDNVTVDARSRTTALTSKESMDITFYDSQKTIPYTLYGFTQNYTHYSPSQTDIVIPSRYLYNVTKNNDSTVQNKDKSRDVQTVALNVNDFENGNQFISKGNSLNVEKLVNSEEFEYNQSVNMFSQNNYEYSDEIQTNIPLTNNESHETINDINNIINKDTETNYYQNDYDGYSDEIQILRDINRNSIALEHNVENNENTSKLADNVVMNNRSFGCSQNYKYLSQNMETNHSLNESEKTKFNNVNYTTDQSNVENPTQNSEINNELAKMSSENDSSEKEELHESEEIISYKVLEEFNKVKSFLNRQNRRMSCDGYSTDSGYRSDSQSSKKNALQLSGNWLNQSGCCLFNYIMQCPLVAGSRDITNEIAQMLSQLIDRLHEEEKYPSFLEDLLETVDLLFRHVYEESSEDGEFLKKDEYIQRIFLLNKSINIQRHSIEQMTNILETFHSKITEADSTYYELTSIVQIENITYIFHILEILLKKYLKNREGLSQANTQTSQDDEKVLKKSSITDIWRKKWNPSQKVFEGSREKKCVLKNCSEILNKIVVDCVSTYSLVAYSALKCFNCMQI